MADADLLQRIIFSASASSPGTGKVDSDRGPRFCRCGTCGRMQLFKMEPTGFKTSLISARKDAFGSNRVIGRDDGVIVAGPQTHLFSML